MANEKRIGSEERNIEGMLLERVQPQNMVQMSLMELPTKKRLVSIHSNNDSE